MMSWYAGSVVTIVGRPFFLNEFDEKYIVSLAPCFSQARKVVRHRKIAERNIHYAGLYKFSGALSEKIVSITLLIWLGTLFGFHVSHQVIQMQINPFKQNVCFSSAMLCMLGEVVKVHYITWHFLLLSQIFITTARAGSRGRCWAAIRLSHRPEPSSRAVHEEVDGLGIEGQNSRRFVLLHHTHRPQKGQYNICVIRNGNVRHRCEAVNWRQC